jgi:hypothetical protein
MSDRQFGSAAWRSNEPYGQKRRRTGGRMMNETRLREVLTEVLVEFAERAHEAEESIRVPPPPDEVDRALDALLARLSDQSLHGFSVVGPDGERMDPRRIR